MKRFKNILLYAGTEQNETAINRSIQLAVENSARLTLMDVVKPIPRALGMLTDVADSDELQRLVAQDHHEKLRQIAVAHQDQGAPIDVVVAIGDPATEIVRQTLRAKHDLVVKTADGSSSVGRLFSSIARSLLRNCPCPVWILKPEIHGEFDNVLAAIDLEDSDREHRNLNQLILQLASSIAERENARLHIVSAWDLWMEQSIRRRAGDEEVDSALEAHEQRVNKSLDGLLKESGITMEDVQIHLHRGYAPIVIRSVADRIEADLMVMGTICRTGAAGFLIGNTAETVLDDLTCSVLALKPDGFRSPVELADSTQAAQP